jgi:Response regulator containing CheY-like receiver, AAA-type ATPase, and DNA-binding domains
MTRILVVDEDPSVCDVVERLLASSGYAVTTATTGRAALEAATKQSFAAAFVDLCMPSMHGLEIINGLRALAPDTKLIVMSGLMADCGGPPAPDFLGMMTNLKGIERLSKPFGRQDLLNLLPDSYIRRAPNQGTRTN